MARKPVPHSPKDPSLPPDQGPIQLQDAIEKGSALLKLTPLPKERYDAWRHNSADTLKAACGDNSPHLYSFAGPGKVQVAFGPVSEQHAEAQRRKDLENQTIPPEYRIDYVCVLKSGGLIHVLPPPEGMKLYAQKNTRVGNLRSDNPLRAFLVVLQNLVLQSWTDPVRLGDYLGRESLGLPRYPSDMAQNPPPQGET
jgi:hypothetical protein